MNKFKKIYCGASFVFACIVIVFTITLSFANPVTTYAASSKSGKSTQSDNRDVADALGDNTNGLSITYNNDSGSISTPVRMLLILTVLTLLLQELSSYYILFVPPLVHRQLHQIRF